MTLTETILGSSFAIGTGIAVTYIRSINSQLLELRLAQARTETQLSPLWARVQAQISSDLHHPDSRYAEMDGLLEKLEALTITESERLRLKQLLLERSIDTHSDINEDQRKKAALMISVMDMVLVEAADKPK